MPKIIGIDLGTTNSVAAIIEADENNIAKNKKIRGFLDRLILLNIYLNLKRAAKFQIKDVINLSLKIFTPLFRGHIFQNTIKLTLFDAQKFIN